MKDRILLSSPHMSGKEKVYVEEAIESNWVTPLGPFVDKMEAMLSSYTNVPNCAVLNSGTSAIHLALKLSRVSEGDYVICQSMTFSATANPIIYEKAKPVFIDSEKDTWNMCPISLERAIKDLMSKGISPKALLLVHLYGMPAKIDEIIRICNTYNLALIEDAAEAIGSSYKGKACGSFGDFGILSFNGNKMITTSGGGALLSRNEKAIKEAKFLATQAKDNAPHYQHSKIGYNYRLSNISAAIGVAQLEVLDNRVQARRENHEFYYNSLKHLSFISFLKEPKDYYSNRWLSCILIDPIKSGGLSCNDIRLALEDENIETRPLWKPMHLQPVFKDELYYGNTVASDLFENGLCLPSGSNLTKTDLERVVNILIKVFKDAGLIK